MLELSRSIARPRTRADRVGPESGSHAGHFGEDESCVEPHTHRKEDGGHIPEAVEQRALFKLLPVAGKLQRALARGSVMMDDLNYRERKQVI